MLATPIVSVDQAFHWLKLEHGLQQCLVCCAGAYCMSWHPDRARCTVHNLTLAASAGCDCKWCNKCKPCSLARAFTKSYAATQAATNAVCGKPGCPAASCIAGHSCQGCVMMHVTSKSGASFAFSTASCRFPKPCTVLTLT